jgi:hypothetical protein
MTCNNADEACPMVFGAEARFSVKYDDPKAFDGTDLMNKNIQNVVCKLPVKCILYSHKLITKYVSN